MYGSEGAEIFVRSGGSGPVVLLLHGYAENSDSWAPLAADLMKDHTVVVPDLRGIGRSSKPVGGYDKKTQAKDIRAVVTGLGYERTFVVAHDIGNMVAYAYAALYPDKVERLVVMDAPIPGIEPWGEILQNPGVWHFNFHGRDAERLVAGRERIYFDRIWNDFTGDPGKPDEATRNFFTASYAQPGGMRAGFAQFAAFSQDAKDNKIFEQVKLPMPVLAVGGEKSFGPLQAVIMRHVATNVQEAVVSGSGQWLIEERPVETVALIRRFLDASGTSAGEQRLSPREYQFPESANPGTGSSGVADIHVSPLSRRKGFSWSCRHPNHCFERRSESAWRVYHHASRTSSYSNRGALSPRRSCCDGNLRNLAHRVRRQIRRSEAESSSSGKLLHRTASPESLCRDWR